MLENNAAIAVARPEKSIGRIGDWLALRYWVVAGLLLAIMGAVQIGSVLNESVTNDEIPHLLSGYAYLTTGDYGFDVSHPALARTLAAIPLLSLHLQPIERGRTWAAFNDFLWHNRVPADTILLYARLPMIALTLSLGVWLAWWTQLHFGNAVGLLALTFFVFDPNVIAHGRYVTTDVPAALGMFLATTLWINFLLSPSWTKLSLAGAALGCAFATKYSALILLLTFPLLYGMLYAMARKRSGKLWWFTMRGGLLAVAVTFLIAGATVSAVYAPEVFAHLRYLRYGGARPGLDKQPLADRIDPKTRTGRMLALMARTTGLPSYTYPAGVLELALYNKLGHPAYLLGRFGFTGWWYYFPIAFLVKTPTAVLIALLFAIGCLGAYWRAGPRDVRIALLAITPALYFAVSMRSAINLGERHIIPVYPFLYVLMAFVLVQYGPRALRSAWPLMLAGIIGLLICESLSIYPYYLSFFNWPSGGPANGSRYLLDSNIDWGQDAKRLATYLKEQRMAPVCSALFGSDPLEYYGVQSRNLFKTVSAEDVTKQVTKQGCVVAVSVNFLKGLYVGPAMFEALRKRQPLARIGSSIYLYDFRGLAIKAVSP